jgi:BirA family biotin operon repressor/biotin-[acetyl-CoA-carboxylase] ligase
MSKLKPSLPAGWRLYEHKCLESTNAEAFRLLRDGAEVPAIVWAQRQTAGRGRHGRAWESPAGNLFVSYLLRPQVPISDAAQLGFVAAIAVADCVAAFARQAEISLKWPNDVLCGGRKVCGILLESASHTPGTTDLVLGIGINIQHAPEKARFPASCLVSEGAPSTLTPEDLLGPLSMALAKWIDRWEKEGFTSIRSAWLARAVGVGREVETSLPGGVVRGLFEDLNSDGALLLRLSSGELRQINAGDVYFPN